MDKKYEVVTEVFGSNVFNDSVMRERLPKDVYKSITKTTEGHQPLDPALANVIANAMK
ncbi:MAG: glutamine synthetase III, partial [Planctomycetes bacterium]|nr:glutamine synthetase III [Planctomycetota bacterium]